MLEFDKNEMERNIEKSKQLTNATRDMITKVIQKNSALADTAAVYSATASLAITSAFIWTYLCTNTHFNFSNNKKVKFERQAWGVALGGGALWVAATFTVPPEKLIGDAQFSVQCIGGIGGEISVSWHKGLQYLGTATGVGLAIHAGPASGSGTFSW